MHFFSSIYVRVLCFPPEEATTTKTIRKKKKLKLKIK